MLTVIVPSDSSATGRADEAGARRDNAVTLGKMLELRRRMEALAVRRPAPAPAPGPAPAPAPGPAHKARSEETLAAPRLLDAPYEDAFARYDGRYTRLDYDVALLPPARAASDRSIEDSVVEVHAETCTRSFVHTHFHTRFHTITLVLTKTYSQ